MDGGITVASGDTVSIHVVKGTFDVAGSVVIPDEFTLNPVTATRAASDISPVTLSWSGLSPLPFMMAATVEGNQLASGTDWYVSNTTPGSTGTFDVPQLGQPSSGDHYTVTVSAENLAPLDGAAGSMLIGSTEQTCVITVN